MGLNLFLVFLLGLYVRHTHQEVFYIAERLPLPGNRPDPGSPWPMPKVWRKDKTVMKLAPEGLNIFPNIQCDIIDEAFARFTQRLLGITKSAAEGVVDGAGWIPSGGLLTEIHVRIDDQDCPTYPQYAVSESYDLNITEAISVRADTVWGALWAFETLGQLAYMVNSVWYLNQTSIHDEPRFAHRGLHMDTARHFYSVDLIKTNLDVMSMNKLNVFHWHMVDAQSFPYGSVKFPELPLKGAFSPRHVYSLSDIADVINHARLRGIRVLPEFDTPGHAQSWGKAKPELLTTCYDNGTFGVAVYGNHSDREIMDPTKNSTFEFLEQFFNEIKDVFKDDFLHMGMDEVHYMCWESSPIIQSFMKDHNISAGDYSGLETYYSHRLLSLIRPMNKRVVIWEDPINHGAQIANDTIIHVWKDTGKPLGSAAWQVSVKDITSKGFRAIFSSCWYLNYIVYGPDWKNYYTCDPYNINATDEELENIVGGEACVWSEYIDETNFMSIVWPRASAVAERLWSDRNVNDTDDATFRLDQHRCRMLRLGFPAKPILPGYCRDDFNTDNSMLPESTSQRTPNASTTSATTKKSGNIATPSVIGSSSCLLFLAFSLALILFL